MHEFETSKKHWKFGARFDKNKNCVGRNVLCVRWKSRPKEERPLDHFLSHRFRRTHVNGDGVYDHVGIYYIELTKNKLVLFNLRLKSSSVNIQKIFFHVKNQSKSRLGAHRCCVYN